MHFRQPFQSSASRGFRLERTVAGFVLACLFFLSGGCTHLSPTKEPIPTVAYPFDPHTRSETLVVFLPGRGGSMDDFSRHGFIGQMRAAGITADAVAVDAHLGYYYRRSILVRLEQDVLKPAREQGYRHIVVVGISLGGLGAVLSTRDLPQYVDAVVLIAPYLGKRTELFDQIRRAGGPAAWAAGRPARSGEVDDELWTFLGQRAGALPPTYLCVGTDDYLRAGQSLLSELLPASHVVALPGAHNWKTWQKLWQRACVEFPVFGARPSLLSGDP